MGNGLQWRKNFKQCSPPKKMTRAWGSLFDGDRLLNTFGNLTILSMPLNSSVSNGPFSAKREALKEHSLLVVNREITKEEEWSEDQICERGGKLFEVAKDLWPYPETSAS